MVKIIFKKKIYLYLYMFFILFKIFFYLLCTESFKIINHPLDNRIGYVYGIKNIKNLDKNLLNELYNIFKKIPLLIIKDVDPPSPNEFINFLKNFDKDSDIEAIENPDAHPHQLLQPFDQFPECKHVVPRGNGNINNFYNIKNINVKPADDFINNYLWHVDLLGHEYKLPNIITGFYILEQPLIGGDTDFISGEKVYESLTDDLKIASKNILLEVNRKKFIYKNKMIDYSGSSRIEQYEEYDQGKTYLPLVFAPDNIYEKERILILPSFFEKIAGWSVEESRIWIKKFMHEHILPHRVSIQWKKKDLAFFNNRRFIHSSTPARNYLDFTDNSKRLFLQTFIPTNKPLRGIKPLNIDEKMVYNVGWTNDKLKSISSSKQLMRYIISTKNFNNDTDYKNEYYVLAKKQNNSNIRINPYKLYLF